MDLALVQVVESDEGYPAHVGVTKGYGPRLVRSAASDLDCGEACWYRTVRSSVLKKIRVRSCSGVDVRKVGAGIDAIRIQDPSMRELSEPVYAIGLRLKSSLRQQRNVVRRVRVGKSDVEDDRGSCGHAEC